MCNVSRLIVSYDNKHDNVPYLISSQKFPYPKFLSGSAPDFIKIHGAGFVGRTIIPQLEKH